MPWKERTSSEGRCDTKIRDEKGKRGKHERHRDVLSLSVLVFFPFRNGLVFATRNLEGRSSFFRFGQSAKSCRGRQDALSESINEVAREGVKLPSERKESVEEVPSRGAFLCVASDFGRLERLARENPSSRRRTK